ncbi:hypothetical protein lerEdw1_020403 [Lerista edwardsae]|nr:hypothetical protein lerEdw1_020403 [Lerista edwardsae]
MRAVLALLAALGSLLLLLCLAWLSGDGSWGARGWEKEAPQRTTDGTPGVMRSLRPPSAAVQLGPQVATNHRTMPNQTGIQKSEQASKCKEMWNSNWSSAIKKKRYSEDCYLQIVGKLQNCTWKKRPQEYAKFKSELASCCDAVHNFIASQNNIPLGINMTYEADNTKTILITEDILRMLPESQPLEYPLKHCAVVGNAGILKDSNCGAEIDKSDFVFRYNKLNEKKTTFLENIADYGDTLILMPAFSFKGNTAPSFKVHHTLREVHAKQKVFFFNPRYLKSLAQYWRSKGVKEFRLSSGLMLTSAAVELCETVKLYGFWPFSKNIDGTPISHHYYDNQLPKPGFHEMPREYNQILQLHGRGVLKLQFGKCLTD